MMASVDSLARGVVSMDPNSDNLLFAQGIAHQEAAGSFAVVLYLIAGGYDSGKMVVHATPGPGCQFVNWSVGPTHPVFGTGIRLSAGSALEMIFATFSFEVLEPLDSQPVAFPGI